MDLSKINTEARNENSFNLDVMSSLEIVTLMNSEDKKIPLAIEPELENISKIVDAAAFAFENGCRLFYMGAGTSGRLGVLDASECPPTFGVSKDLVIGLIAGGDIALRNAVEKAEDSESFGKTDLEKHYLCKGDVVVGLAASGRTPYVIGGLKYANSLGCVTASIACTKNSEIGKLAKIAVEAVPGPEVLTGSTRLKSGTTQKMICNMITTAAMVKSGKVYENLMVDVIQTNEKLHTRAENIVIAATGIDHAEARNLIDAAHGKVKVAIVMNLSNCSFEEAQKKLENSHGHVREAIN